MSLEDAALPRGTAEYDRLAPPPYRRGVLSRPNAPKTLANAPVRRRKPPEQAVSQLPLPEPHPILSALHACQYFAANRSACDANASPRSPRSNSSRPTTSTSSRRVDTALDLTSQVQTAYSRAKPSERRLFNQAIFECIWISDGHTTKTAKAAPFRQIATSIQTSSRSTPKSWRGNSTVMR